MEYTKGAKKLSEINSIDKEIAKLEAKKAQLEADNFKEASKHWFTLMNAKYESSSIRTPEYLTFCRVFKSQFKKLLNELFDIETINISKPNHFDVTGFFELANGRIYYFSIGDLRSNNTFMIRAAKSFEDYTGGHNQYCVCDDFEGFLKDLKSIVDNTTDNNLGAFEHKACSTGLFMATKKEARKAICNKCNEPFLGIDEA